MYIHIGNIHNSVLERTVKSYAVSLHEFSMQQIVNFGLHIQM